MNSIVTFLSRHLRSVLFLATLLLAAGVLAALHLRQELEPAVTTHYAVITATLPGSTAQELQEMVARPVEELLRQTPGITDYASRAGDGFCVFTVELDSHAGSTLEVRERLRNRLAALRQDMARNITGLDGPQLDDSSAMTYDLIVGIPVPAGDSRKLRDALAAVTRDIAAIPAVDGIRTIGLPADQIIVEYRDAELANAGFSPQLLCGLLKTQSFLAPGGYLTDAGKLSCVHTDARLRTADELREVSVLDPVAGRPTTLDRLMDVKAVQRTPPNPAVTIAGKPGLCLAVARRAGADPKEFSSQLRQRISSSCAQAGLGEPVFLLDNAEFISRDYRNFMGGLAVSGAIILLLLIAIMGWRTGGLVAIMIPLVIFSTLATLQMAGFTVNLVVLAALTIASGIVIDNHIVVAQYLARRLHRGLPRLEAAAETFRILSGPLLAATLTAIAGFLPIILADHIAGEYLADLVPVMAIALFFSYLYAFTVTPFLCQPSAAATPLVSRLEQTYRQLLGQVLLRPRTTLAAAAVLAAGGILLLAQRPSTFFPSNSRTMLAIEVLFPAGTSQECSAKAIQEIGGQVEKALSETGATGNAAWMTLSGCGLPRFSRNMAPTPAAPNFATALVTLDTPADFRKFQTAFSAKLKAGKAELGNPRPILRVHPISGGPQISWPVQICLKGSAEALAKALPEAGKTLAAMPTLANLHQDGGGDIAKLAIVPKRRQAADKGVTPADIAIAMNAVINGLPAFDLGSGDQAIPVLVRPKPAKGATADQADNLRDAYVYPLKGLPCLLDDVAEVKTITAPATVERCRGIPAATFVADCAPGASPYEAEREAVAILKKALAKHPGVTIESAGLAKTAAEANHALIAKMPWALAAMFLVLLLQTRSFRLNLLILASIPLGIAGAGLGLALAGMPVGFMPLIGLTTMAGIAVNVTIVMVASITDRSKLQIANDELRMTNEKTENGDYSNSRNSPDAWIIDAAADRVEPILLSIACAVGGMIPLYIFGGELWHSMVVTLIAGLLAAALLLVFTVPAAFKLIRS